MTAATAPARHRPADASRVAPRRAARLLWIELRRNPMPLILPLIAALFWFDSYRPSTGQPPIYVLRTFWNMGQGATIIDFGPLVAGMAAWIGSREGRRGTADLVTATAPPRWAAQLITWAATAIWAVAAYLVFVAVLFGVYAYQGVTGQPPWWWVAVGATAVAAFSAAGFAVGVFFPSRFAAPLATFGGFLAMMASSQTGFREQSGWALVLPTNSNGNYELPSGVSYSYLPDLPIARIMLLAGVAVVVLGLLGLPSRAGGRRRLAAAAFAVSGVALAATAVALASTARLTAQGMAIPALHDAANDQPIRYTPVCGHAAGVPVCLNPAYRRYLSDVEAALAPAFSEVSGLPGAPARAAQAPGSYDGTNGMISQAMTISGRPPVLSMVLDSLNTLPGSVGFTDSRQTARQFNAEIRVLFAHAFAGAGLGGQTPAQAAGAGAGTPAQQAVQAALLRGAGVPFAAQPKALGIAGLLPSDMQNGNGPLPATGPVYAAAKRFAALPAATRHAWLATHLPALRSGQLTMSQIP